MFSEDQLKSVKELAEKNPEVKMLLDFWEDAQKDGVEMVRMELSTKLTALSREINSRFINFDTYDKIIEISKVMKKLPKNKEEIELRKKNSGYVSVKKRAHEGKIII